MIATARLTTEMIKEAIGECDVVGNSNDLLYSGISTDSREINDEQLFIALKGEHFDGSDFVSDVYVRGAKGAISEKPFIDLQPDFQLILVKNSLLALHELAAFHRRHLSCQVVAVTGSNGKTTTKDMIASVLSQGSKVQKTEGNLNNLIGVPLTLLNLTEDIEIAVIEIGANGFGEIARSAELAFPKVGVITNICQSHLEGFGNIEGVYAAKKELVDALPLGGMAFLNGDDEYLQRMASNIHCSVTTFGIGEKNDVHPNELKLDNDGSYSFKLGEQIIKLPTIGKGNVYNSLAAASLGKYFGISEEGIKQGLESVVLAGMRMQRERLGELTLLIDCYNANPASVQLALETLKDLKGKGKKIAVLGDMLELGDDSERLHYEVGKKCSDIDLDILITVGERAGEIASGCEEEISGSSVYIEVIAASNIDDGWKELSKRIKSDEQILFKASRGVGLEAIVNKLRQAHK